MRTTHEKGFSNNAHIREACEVSETLPEAQKLLREAGFSFKRERVHAIWASLQRDPDCSPLSFD